MSTQLASNCLQITNHHNLALNLINLYFVVEVLMFYGDCHYNFYAEMFESISVDSILPGMRNASSSV